MKKVILLVSILAISIPSMSQGIFGGKVTGNFQLDVQASKEDKVIGAEDVKEKILSNAFANILYTNGNFSAGMRFESYLNPILGFDPQYKGSGIPYRFASYKKDFLEVTVGNFYEQFGTGLVFRSYEERNLGLDNAMDGLRVVARPAKGVQIKGIIGKQRYYWDNVWERDDIGLVRGLDGDFSLNEIIPSFRESSTKIILGGSFVSVYDKADPKSIVDTTISTGREDSYKMYMPDNIGAGAGRVMITHKSLNLFAEYAYKGQDPNAINDYIYKPGEALFLSASYTGRGIGVNLSAKRIDNMSYKSRRTEFGNMLNVNYLPALTRQHSYSLFGMYPYATQVNGEMGVQLDVIYKIKKNTFLGGKYGTDVKFNYSRAMSIEMDTVSPNMVGSWEGTNGYKSPFFKPGDELYFQEINLEVAKKISSDLKMNFMYSYQTFNPIAIGHQGAFIYANIFMADATYRISKKNSIRGELQWLITEQNHGGEAKGSWAQGTLEYNHAGKWFVALTDQWNYGNKYGEKVHYYNVSAGYTKGTTRVQIGYGKQRDGVTCIGGVCRPVPASNGLFATITSSF